MNEDQLNKAAIGAVYDGISKAMAQDYNGPIRACVNHVFELRKDKLNSVALDALDSVIDSKEFPETIRSALRDKVARTLVSRMGGEIEKQVNELKANPETRARLTIALSNIAKGG